MADPTEQEKSAEQERLARERKLEQQKKEDDLDKNLRFDFGIAVSIIALAAITFHIPLIREWIQAVNPNGTSSRGVSKSASDITYDGGALLWMFGTNNNTNEYNEDGSKDRLEKVRLTTAQKWVHFLQIQHQQIQKELKETEKQAMHLKTDHNKVVESFNAKYKPDSKITYNEICHFSKIFEEFNEKIEYYNDMKKELNEKNTNITKLLSDAELRLEKVGNPPKDGHKEEVENKVTMGMKEYSEAIPATVASLTVFLTSVMMFLRSTLGKDWGTESMTTYEGRMRTTMGLSVFAHWILRYFTNEAAYVAASFFGLVFVAVPAFTVCKSGLTYVVGLIQDIFSWLKKCFLYFYQK